ncbi:MAG: outer membrane protein [Sphingomonas sp.]
MRILTATAFALAMAATPAFAQDTDKAFDGPYVAVVGGAEEAGNPSTGNTGAFAGGVIGYDHQSGNLVLGIEGEATLSTTERCVAGICNNAGRDLYAGGRVGYVVGGNTMIYAKGGYTNGRLALPMGTQTLDGWRAGGGVETNITGSTFVRAEYRYSGYAADAHKHQGTVGVGVRF